MARHTMNLPGLQTAVKGVANHGMGAATQSAPRPDAPVWEKVSWWNWHRWFGLDLRRSHSRAVRNGITWWEYGNSKKVARNVLSSLYDPARYDDACMEQGRVMTHAEASRRFQRNKNSSLAMK